MIKILVIDDDQDIVTLLTEALEINDFAVVAACDSMQGTTLAHNEKPDLILLDLIMPLGGGELTLRNLKMSVHTKEIPIIVISGTGDEHLIEKVKSMGIEEFIPKPFDPNDLISKIKEILLKE